MPIAKMRASNCPTTTQVQQTPHEHNDPLVALKAPPRTSIPSQHSNLQKDPTRTARRMGDMEGAARELLNLSVSQTQILKDTATNLTAHRYRRVVGGTVEIRTDSMGTASALLSVLGFHKLKEAWTLADPRFTKCVELQHGITTLARATIEATPRGATINVTIERDWAPS